MKKFTKINYILTFILVFCIGATLPILIGSSHVDEQHSAKSEVPYCVTSPTVPEQVTFDGETIDLRRYDRRERMDREMMAFTYMHSTTMLLIKRANRYFPIIEPILKANGIPDDFKYLMVIESNLNNIARSPAGAAGLWQFMPATGREFGLEVNENVDERYHIEKATVAACKYFKQAYAKYGDWMAVSAAYNAGQGRISSQLDQQLASHAMDFRSEGCRLMAGRRDFPLYVPPAGSQRNIQESSAIWIPAEKGTLVPAYPLQRDNGHYPHCQLKRFCQTAGNHIRPTSGRESLATRTKPKKQDRKNIRSPDTYTRGNVL